MKRLDRRAPGGLPNRPRNFTGTDEAYARAIILLGFIDDPELRRDRYEDIVGADDVHEALFTDDDLHGLPFHERELKVAHALANAAARGWIRSRICEFSCQIEYLITAEGGERLRREVTAC